METLPKRKNIRLDDHLYVGGHVYFVTVCTYHRIECLGDIVDGKMILNTVGKIVSDKIQALPQYFDLVVEKQVVMPNHIHFLVFGNTIHLSKIVSSLKRHCVISIKNTVRAGERSSPLREVIESKNTIWQKSYYDRIVRNQKEYDQILQYIDQNPLRWELDSLHPENDT